MGRNYQALQILLGAVTLAQQRHLPAEMLSGKSSEKWYKAWQKDMDRIGDTQCVEPGSSIDALDGMANTLGSFESLKESLV